MKRRPEAVKSTARERWESLDGGPGRQSCFGKSGALRCLECSASQSTALPSLVPGASDDSELCDAGATKRVLLRATWVKAKPRGILNDKKATTAKIQES